MTEVNFRDIPLPRYPEDELASEPWYSVSPGDVFPEEFRHWLCADPRIGPLFEEMHADLFRADYWRALQNRIREGHVEDVYAYRRRQRFSVRFVLNQRRKKSAYSTVRQRHFLRRFNHHRAAKLGHAVIGNT